VDDRKGLMNNSVEIVASTQSASAAVIKTIEYLTDKEFCSSRILNIMLSKTMGYAFNYS